MRNHSALFSAYKCKVCNIGYDLKDYYQKRRDHLVHNYNMQTVALRATRYSKEPGLSENFLSMCWMM